MADSETLVTVIVPVYNEEAHLEECLRSLQAQTYRPLEIIVVDDGSQDHTVAIARECGVRVLRQRHLGKARAISVGATIAQGRILAFLDGDLRFAPTFIERLVDPILHGKCLGTSHADELVANPENVWSRCFQLVAGMPPDRRIDLSQRERAEGTVVYRAVNAEAFQRVGGFDDIGYSDDQTLAAKLGQQAHFVSDAVCYHYNPETISEVFGMGSWQGKTVWHHHSWSGLFRHFPLRGLVRGLRAAVRHRFLPLAIYVPVVESGIFWGVTKRALRVDRTYGA